MHRLGATLVAAAAVFVACGQILSEAETTPIPPVRDRPDGGDAARVDIPTGACTGGWDEPVRLEGSVNSPTATMPRITKDGRRLYFGRQPTGGQPWTLWVARRAARGQLFGEETQLKVNTSPTENVFDAALTADEKQIFFTAQAVATPDDYRIHRASLDGDGGAGGGIEVMSFGLTDRAQQGPFIDGTTLYFTAASGRNAPAKLYRVSLGGTSAPTEVPLSSAPIVRNPMLFANGNALLVTALGITSRNTIRIAVADGGAFAGFEPLPIANSTASESPGSFDEEECTLYFTRVHRLDGGGDRHEIWTAKRQTN